jgi:radical SAM superfamily enzyme YgiQ (UPF0313 family)
MEKNGSRGYPMGILSISAYLKHKGYQQIKYIEYDLYSKFTYKKKIPIQTPLGLEINDERIKWIVSEQPDILLIGPIFTYNIGILLKYARFIKKLIPSVLIVTGGPHFGKDLQLDEDFLKLCPELLGIVVGDGEETVFHLISLINADKLNPTMLDENEPLKKKLGHIPGFLVLNEDFTIRKPFDINHNRLMPDYDLLATNHFQSLYTLASRKNPQDRNGDYLLEKLGGTLPYAYVNGSRGCPYKCIFCAGSNRIWDTKIKTNGGFVKRRTRNPTEIANEIFMVYEKFNTKLFFFTDPLFIFPSRADFARIDKLFSLILDFSNKNKVKFTFIIELRVDVVNKLPITILMKMIQAGVREINIGFEKSTNRGLQLFDKNITIKDHIRAIRKIRQISRFLEEKVMIIGTFVIGGLNESLWESIYLVFYVLKLKLDTFRLFPLEIFPGTQVSKMCYCKNVIKRNLESYLSGVPIYSRSKLELKLLILLKKIGDLISHFKWRISQYIYNTTYS